MEETFLFEMESDDTKTVEQEESIRKIRRRSKRRKKREVKLSQFDFNIPGVTRIELGERTQRELECIVGEDVTSEHPWKFVSKELFEDSIILNEASEFLPLRLDILSYPRDKFLLGYAADESRENDEFYLCLTEFAEDKINEVITKLKKEQEEFLAQAIHKRVRLWKSFGSEKEIEEYTEKSNRELLEVEVEASYPVMSPKCRFKLRLVENARDGYVELLKSKSELMVPKRRIDAGVQIAPSKRTSISQTKYTYPRNAWTQYHYEFEKIEEIPQAFIQNLFDFMSSNLDFFCDQLRVNDNINLYTNDYTNLVNDPQYTKPPGAVQLEEYMSFADLGDARNKMVSSISWHPMWSGTIAIAYSRHAPNTCVRGKRTAEEIHKMVHDRNSILIWCFNDGLKPKLYLECHRQVEYVSFCPFNENIIVGACNNGQIVIWDIRHKLEKVEEVEILTTAQQKYRVFMTSLMNWMKNTRNLSHVRVTAESDLSYSHVTCATSIQWLSPYWKVNKSGRYEAIGEGKPLSLQFATSSADGSTLFWDLLAKPVVTKTTEYRPQKRLRRLKVRPSALTLDVSPFRMLNRILKPHYKVNVHSNKKDMPLLLSSLSSSPINVTYKDPKADRKYNLTERVIYEPVLTPSEIAPAQELICGTYDGYVIKVRWDGYEVSPGDLLNQEAGVITSIGRYHDGPVTCIERHPVYPDTFLSVGGKVFAIWNSEYKDRPIIWRKSRSRYMHGRWDKIASTGIRLCRSDGNREVWHFLKRSDKMYYEQTLSGNTILGSYMHPLGANVLGISDFNGTFRMFHVPEHDKSNLDKEQSMLKDLFDREIFRKIVFQKWQNEWLKKNEALIQERNEKINLFRQAKIEREKIEQKRQQEEQLLREKEEAALAELRARPAPGQYLKWAHAKWIEKEHERMNKVLLVKKRLDPKLLVSQQMPLKMLEMEEERKKAKQKERLQNSDKLFTETVAMLFPDVIKKKPQRPWDPYGGGDSIEAKQECMDEYQKSAREAEMYIKDNPFTYKFNWKAVTQAGRIRRKTIENQYVTSHKLRHQNEKLRRLAGISEEGITSYKPKSEVSSVNESITEDVGEEASTEISSPVLLEIKVLEEVCEDGEKLVGLSGLKESVAPAELDRTPETRLPCEIYPFATVLRLRVLQIVCGITFLIMGTVGFIEEKGELNLGLGIPAGAATILAAAASVHTTRGFGGYRTSTCIPGSPLRFLGPSIRVAVPLTILWGTACSFLTVLLIQSTRTLTYATDIGIEEEATDLTILASVELLLSIVTLLAVIFLLRIDCKYDQD